MLWTAINVSILISNYCGDDHVLKGNNLYVSSSLCGSIFRGEVYHDINVTNSFHRDVPHPWRWFSTVCWNVGIINPKKRSSRELNTIDHGSIRSLGIKFEYTSSYISLFRYELSKDALVFQHRLKILKMRYLYSSHLNCNCLRGFVKASRII